MVQLYELNLLGQVLETLSTYCNPLTVLVQSS